MDNNLNFRFYALSLLIVCAIAGNSLNSQTLRLNSQSFNMTIYGTTNIHDFQSKVTQASGQLVINGSREPQLLYVEIPVKSIKSNDKLMDTKTYRAFNVEQYPTISFRMTDANSLKVSGEDISVTAIGDMTINGVTKKMAIRSLGKVVKPGVYEFSGSIALHMSDFKMSPPTAMLGMMKVGDAVLLKYRVTFEGPPVN